MQVFEGVVIKRQGAGARETFTVRKNSFGVGVERTFPVHSPKIEKIEVGAIGDVNRAKLYYLRGKVGKKARVREKQRTQPSSSPARAGARATTTRIGSCDPPRARRAAPARARRSPVVTRLSWKRSKSVTCGGHPTTTSILNACVGPAENF